MFRSGNALGQERGRAEYNALRLQHEVSLHAFCLCNEISPFGGVFSLGKITG